MENRRYYKEIEPFCKWKKDEQEEVLEIRLQAGIRKEQLRVEINSSGVLTISGESAEDGSRLVRFRKEVIIHPYCQREKIHAKLSGENLYITMPTRIPIVIPQIQENGKPKQNVDKDELPHAALSMLSKTALKLGALVAVVVAAAVGAYVAYKYRQGFHVD